MPFKKEDASGIVELTSGGYDKLRRPRFTSKVEPGDYEAQIVIVPTVDGDYPEFVSRLIVNVNGSWLRVRLTDSTQGSVIGE